MLHLSDYGSAVSKPLPLPDGELVMQVGEFVVSQFERALGRAVLDTDRSAQMHQVWGKCLAEFHLHAQTFSPKTSPRYQWQDDLNVQFRKRIPLDHSRVIERADHNWSQLSALPKTKETYGLIHCDPHAGNFFIESGKDTKLTFFDFDDCCYQWFVFDVATSLFAVVLNNPANTTPLARADAAKWFLDDFFTGYGAVFPVTHFMLEQMQLFIRTRELSLYGVIHAHLDPDNLVEDFPRRFMAGRRDALENDVPFIDLDFVHAFG